MEVGRIFADEIRVVREVVDSTVQTEALATSIANVAEVLVGHFEKWCSFTVAPLFLFQFAFCPSVFHKILIAVFTSFLLMF